MINFKEYLKEDKEGKNVHLDHIEDAIFMNGVSGAMQALHFIQSLRDMLHQGTGTKVNLTTKFDGAPAIIAGINPDNNKFFVGTKGVFAQNAKLNYTAADIDANHPGPGLNEKLKIALKYLPQLGIRNVLQGDMMFTQNDLKAATINGEKVITFHPNTIVYAVPETSALATQIKVARMGIVWHTEYIGDSLPDMKAKFGANVKALKPSKDVWYRDASFVDATGAITLSDNEHALITQYLNQAEMAIKTISPSVIAQITSSDKYRIELMAWNNLKVRAGEKINDTHAHVKDFISHTETKLNSHILGAKREDTKLNREKEKNVVLRFYQQHSADIKKILDFQNMIVNAKNIIIHKLQQVKDIGTFIKTDDGYKVTAPEGFVAIDLAKGNAVKLVDRLTFSRQNFTAKKSWSTK